MRGSQMGMSHSVDVGAEHDQCTQINVHGFRCTNVRRQCTSTSGVHGCNTGVCVVESTGSAGSTSVVLRCTCRALRCLSSGAHGC